MKTRINKIRLIFRVILILLIILGCSGLSYWYHFKYNRNFNTVVKSKIYRSAQPELGNIKYWHHKYGIASILNLRGSEIFKTEPSSLQVYNYANDKNIEYYSQPLTASKVLTKDQLLNLINILDKAKKPLLLHCQSGAERSGLVSAIAQLLDNQSISTAMAEFSLLKGFVPYRESEILKILLEDYSKWLAANNQNSSREYFISWASQYYIPYYYSFKINLIDKLGAIKPNIAQTIKVQLTNTSHHAMPLKAVEYFGKNGVYLYACYYNKSLADPTKDCYKIAQQYEHEPESNYDKARFLYVKNQDVILKSGDSIYLDLTLPAIPVKGSYAMELELIEGDRFMFHDYTNQIFSFDFDVV